MYIYGLLNFQRLHAISILALCDVTGVPQATHNALIDLCLVLWGIF